MRAELPVFTRCCLCLPLRYGLIVWGYIRLVIGVVLLVSVIKGFYELIEKTTTEPGYEIYVTMVGFFLLLTLADVVLTIVFIIGGHKKNLKLLKAYYIYSFVLWILMIIMGISLTAYAVYVMNQYEMDVVRVWYLLIDLATFLAQILIQAYVLLLVRSVFKKLADNCEFRFVNNAAEPVCKMKCEEDNNITNGDKEVIENEMCKPKHLYNL